MAFNNDTSKPTNIPASLEAVREELVHQASLRPEAIREASQRAIMQRVRGSSTGGMRLKLAVSGAIEGYHLYWENDTGSSIDQLLSEGFEFVTRKEISLNSFIVADDDLDDRISRYVGAKEDGSPMRSYLMKCPQELWDDRQLMAQEQADQWDSAILEGTLQNVENRYTPKGYKTSLTAKASS